MIQSNLSVLMAERGLKIADLYEATGISKTTLMALSENTGKGVQFDTIDKLCNYLGVTPHEFFDYAPYMLNVKYDNFNDDDLNHIAMTVKKQFYERTFYISMFVQEAKHYVALPVNAIDIDLYVPVYLEDSDAYDNEEFYSFLSSLSISFRTKITNEILNLTVDSLNKHIGKEITHCDRLLSENDVVLIHLFSDSRFEMLKKVTLKQLPKK